MHTKPNRQREPVLLLRLSLFFFLSFFSSIRLPPLQRSDPPPRLPLGCLRASLNSPHFLRLSTRLTPHRIGRSGTRWTRAPTRSSCGGAHGRAKRSYLSAFAHPNTPRKPCWLVALPLFSPPPPSFGAAARSALNAPRPSLSRPIPLLLRSGNWTARGTSPRSTRSLWTPWAPCCPSGEGEAMNFVLLLSRREEEE